MQELKSTFSPRGLFRNAHFSTIYPALFRKIEIRYTRKRIITADTDFFDVDYIDASSHHYLILLHGLEGSSNSAYIKGMASYFNQLNVTVCALNFRSCSGVMNRLPGSYHSGFTEDLRLFLNQLITSDPDANIYLCGFSLGGNVLLKYLGEEGLSIHPQIKSAVAVSVPANLKSSAEVLSKWYNKVYMQRFLKSLIGKMKMKSSMFPHIIKVEGIDSITDFYEFDERYTAPLHGFEGALDYWNKCSSINYLDKIKIPTLFLSAENDPFLHPDCFPDVSDFNNPFLHVEYPRQGGHVGFLSGYKGNSWIESRASSFFNMNENALL